MEREAALFYSGLGGAAPRGAQSEGLTCGKLCSRAGFRSAAMSVWWTRTGRLW